MQDAIEAAKRIIAIDEGSPGADDTVEYLDSVAVARALLTQAGAQEKTLQVWSWGDPEDELRRFDNINLYAKRPVNAPDACPLTLTLTPPPKPKKEGR